MHGNQSLSVAPSRRDRNLRPCRGGGPHMPGVERDEAWRQNREMARKQGGYNHRLRSGARHLATRFGKSDTGLQDHNVRLWVMREVDHEPTREEVKAFIGTQTRLIPTKAQLESLYQSALYAWGRKNTNSTEKRADSDWKNKIREQEGRQSKKPNLYGVGKDILSEGMTIASPEAPLYWEARGLDLYFAHGFWFMRSQESRWAPGEWLRVTNPVMHRDIEAAFKGGKLQNPKTAAKKTAINRPGADDVGPDYKPFTKDKSIYNEAPPKGVELPAKTMPDATAARERVSRRAANDEFAKISKKYWDSIPVKQISEILTRFGFDAAAMEGIYTGRDGKTHDQVGPRTWLALQWHKMEESGHYEINCYLS